MTRRAIVIGGSVAGLLAGNLLLRRGWDVQVHERSGDDLAGRGAGIARHAGMTPVMAAAGAAPTDLDGFPTGARVLFDRDGRELLRYDYDQVLSSWGSIYNALRKPFPSERYHRRKELVAIEQSAAVVTARFADGSSLTGDLLVGADGFLATTRSIVEAGTRPTYSGYVAWRGLAEGGDLLGRFPDHYLEKYAFCFPPRGMYVHYPLDNGLGDARLRKHHFLWYDHTGKDGDAATPGSLADLLTDAGGRTHAYNIPPPLIRSVHIERLKRVAKAELPAPYAEIVLRSKSFILQPIYDVYSRHMAFGRVATLGDAAFVARPHVGIGVLKAAEDAAALVEALETIPSVVEALQAYEATRLPVGQDAVLFARFLGGWLEQGEDQPESDPGLRLSREVVISCSARPVARDVAEAIATRANAVAAS